MVFPLTTPLRPLYIVVVQYFDTRWRFFSTVILIIQIFVMVYVLEIHSNALAMLSERLARVETKIDLLKPR